MVVARFLNRCAYLLLLFIGAEGIYDFTICTINNGISHNKNQDKDDDSD